MKDLKTTWETEVGKIFKDLTKVALADGTITSDERQILETVRQDINKFVKAYIRALDDKKITEKETEELKACWTNVLTHAKTTANKDGIITPDERAMLVRISKSVMD